MKDGKLLTTDIDYVDVWRVRKEWKNWNLAAILILKIAAWYIFL